MNNIRKAILVFTLLLYSVVNVFATNWTAIEQKKFGYWEYTHNQYLNTGNKFCAAETHNNEGTTFRLNFFYDGKTHFLEIFNKDWDYFEGNVNFSVLFADGHKFEFKGKSWGNSYTYDFLDRKNTFVFLGLLSKNSKIKIINANNGNMGDFKLNGSNTAIQTMLKCAGIS